MERAICVASEASPISRSGRGRRVSLDLPLRLLALLLPRLVRLRYLEEWRADLVGASQLGLPRRDVVLGAFSLVVRIDRDRPEHSGEPRGALPRRLARRGGGLLVAAAGVLAGLYLTGGNLPDPGVAPSAAPLFLIASRGLAILALAAGACAVLFLLGAGIAARTWLTRGSLLALITGPALVAAGFADPAGRPVAPLIGLMVLLAGLIGGAVVAAGSPALQLQPRTASRARRVPVAVGGMTLLLAVVALGGVDALIWNPQSKVPGQTVQAIYAGMIERDGFDIAMHFSSIAIWAVLWTAAGVAVLVGACRRSAAALTPRRIAILMLGLTSAAVFFRFFASFGIGMSIADSFNTGGGDGSAMSAVLAFIGQLTLAGSAIALGWVPRPIRGPGTLSTS
ncbi:hypothetical protein [Amnibacterium endophyticum]|uniref:Integral membrane protein n=1 Tax=Amnibacterium endophyticum TaxID=2109337 RepID=A0ABW4LF24_9MICO